MSDHAAFSAAQSNSSLKAPGVAIQGLHDTPGCVLDPCFLWSECRFVRGCIGGEWASPESYR
jgi:hypothetical protein